MPRMLSIRAFAEEIDRSEAMVRKYIKSGRISESSLDRSQIGKILVYVKRAKNELEESRNAIFNINSDPDKKAKTRWNKELPEDEKNESEKNKPAKKEVDKPQSKNEENAPSEVPVGATTEEYKKQSLADLTKIKQIRDIQLMDVKIGEANKTLVPVDSVYSALFKIGVEIREAFEAFPERTVDDVRLADTRHKAIEIMKKEVYEVLIRLTDAGRNLQQLQ